jgi:hypothetical protein
MSRSGRHDPAQDFCRAHLGVLIELVRRCAVSEVLYIGMLLTNTLEGLFRLARASLGRTTQPSGALSDARTRFVVAHSLYAQTAREVNTPLGRVVFGALDARLETAR